MKIEHGSLVADPLMGLEFKFSLGISRLEEFFLDQFPIMWDEITGRSCSTYLVNKLLSIVGELYRYSKKESSISHLFFFTY